MLHHMSTITPASMHIAFSDTLDGIGSNNNSNGLEDIDTVLAECSHPGPPQNDRKRYPEAAASYDSMAQELQPLQNGQHSHIVSRARPPNEPFIPLDTSMLPGRRSSGSNLLPEHYTEMDFSNPTSRLHACSNANLAGKAHSVLGIPLDSGYHSNTLSPASRSLNYSCGYPHGLPGFGDDYSTIPPSCRSLRNGFDYLDKTTVATEQLPYDPFEDDSNLAFAQVNFDIQPNANIILEGLKGVPLPDGPPWHCKECVAPPFKNKSEFK